MINNFKARVMMTCAQQGISLAAVARRLGVSRQTVHAVLNKRTHRDVTIRRWAEALGVHFSVFDAPVDPTEYGNATIPRF